MRMGVTAGDTRAAGAGSMCIRASLLRTCISATRG